jgi:hypothetical protein
MQGKVQISLAASVLTPVQHGSVCCAPRDRVCDAHVVHVETHVAALLEGVGLEIRAAAGLARSDGGRGGRRSFGLQCRQRARSSVHRDDQTRDELRTGAAALLTSLTFGSGITILGPGHRGGHGAAALRVPARILTCSGRPLDLHRCRDWRRRDGLFVRLSCRRCGWLSLHGVRRDCRGLRVQVCGRGRVRASGEGVGTRHGLRHRGHRRRSGLARRRLNRLGGGLRKMFAFLGSCGDDGCRGGHRRRSHNHRRGHRRRVVRGLWLVRHVAGARHRRL